MFHDTFRGCDFPEGDMDLLTNIDSKQNNPTMTVISFKSVVATRIRRGLFKTDPSKL